MAIVAETQYFSVVKKKISIILQGYVDAIKATCVKIEQCSAVGRVSFSF